MNIKSIYVRFGYKLHSGGGVAFDAKASDIATPESVLKAAFQYLAFAAIANHMSLAEVVDLVADSYARSVIADKQLTTTIADNGGATTKGNTL